MGAILVSDYRHFAHGRHQWFDKQKDSAIIALTSAPDEMLSSKTLQLLPSNIPKLVLQSNIDSYEATIDLLIQSMIVVNIVGYNAKIDPGKPGVPEYGSKIYHLRYEKLLNTPSLSIETTAILRKANVDNILKLNSEEYIKWQNGYKNFINKISSNKYGSLILDYDGTLCSAENRFLGITAEIKEMLLSFVKKGFVLGIISGRGKSLRDEINKVFTNAPELKNNVVVGYYNGSDIAVLSNQNRPIKKAPLHKSLKIIAKRSKALKLEFDISPNQLTFGSNVNSKWYNIRRILLNEVMLLKLKDITIVESSHSIDIIPMDIASKNNIIKHCRKKCKDLGLALNPLCIGDKGQWPGNDYLLLSNPFALSVGEVSSSPNTGWNICPPGMRDEKGMAYLFDKIKMNKDHFVLQGI